MKKLFLFIILIVAGCSDEPVDMDKVLYDRSGQYITSDNYSSYFFFNQKVYNGPAYNSYRTGEKREQGSLKNGYQSGAWTGWGKDGKKKFTGTYSAGKAQGKWTGFHPNGKKKYEGLYYGGFQVGKWIYFNENEKKTLEETYYDCDNKCEDAHPLRPYGTYICTKLGNVTNSKTF